MPNLNRIVINAKRRQRNALEVEKHGFQAPLVALVDPATLLHLEAFPTTNPDFWTMHDTYLEVRTICRFIPANVFTDEETRRLAEALGATTKGKLRTQLLYELFDIIAG